MPNKLLARLTQTFQEANAPLLLVRNPDRWLMRPALQQALRQAGIWMQAGTALHHRIHFEQQYKAVTYRTEFPLTIYLVDAFEDMLEDIRQEAAERTFSLSDLLPDYPVAPLLDAPLPFLEELYNTPPVYRKVSPREVSERLRAWKARTQKLATHPPKTDQPDLERLQRLLHAPERMDGLKAILPVSEAIRKALAHNALPTLWPVIQEINAAFQQQFTPDFFRALPSRSYIKRPWIVSHVLPYLHHHYGRKKLLLLVIDGLAYWQYLMLEAHLNTLGLRTQHRPIYTWVPSITQLARQALFRGGAPAPAYQQQPREERKLWVQYWQAKQVPPTHIEYQHGQELPLPNPKWEKVAWVDIDLDEKMHLSTDYRDLYVLTRNWMERQADSWASLGKFANAGYTIFLTTDHGNVEAQGWRTLTAEEKRGTRQVGSRSARHLEYESSERIDNFIGNNPDIHPSIAKYGQYAYLVDDKIFSNDAVHVTHGGSHLLEAIIPFAQITHE